MSKVTGSLLVLLAMLLTSVRGEVQAAIYRRIPLPSDHQLDPAFLAYEMSSVSSMSKATCAGACRIQRACFYFSVTEQACQMYHRVNLVIQANSAISYYYEIPAILMFRHDITDGQFFPIFTGWALNKHNEDALQYSRLDEINNYIGNDKKYHLK